MVAFWFQITFLLPEKFELERDQFFSITTLILSRLFFLLKKNYEKAKGIFGVKMDENEAAKRFGIACVLLTERILTNLVEKNRKMTLHVAFI